MIFTLPQLFLTCFTYQMHSGEVMNGWQVKQPIIIDMRGIDGVTISNSHFHHSAYCGDVILAGQPNCWKVGERSGEWGRAFLPPVPDCTPGTLVPMAPRNDR